MYACGTCPVFDSVWNTDLSIGNETVHNVYSDSQYCSGYLLQI